MPARQSRTAATTASTLSLTTTLVPVVSAIVVSGLASTVTIRAGLWVRGAGPAPRRCSWIMASVSSYSGLAEQVDQVVEPLVGRRDHPGHGMEAGPGGR